MDSGSPEHFTDLGTIGIEEEFFVVDSSGIPTSGTDTLVYEEQPPDLLAGRLDHELFKFVIETQTPILETLSEGQEMVEAVRETLSDYAQQHGFQIAGAGLHPLAKWRTLEHAEKPRYRSQLNRIQYPQHRNTTAGLHIHIGVDDPDKAVWIANKVRWHLPVMLALSVNSPYWNGFDTGLQSARAKIFEGLPNTGMPTAFESYEDFDTFEHQMLTHDSINDRGELWFDVRPHSGHGTVEIRVPDGQHDPKRAYAFVEYTYKLVLDLAERYEDNESSNWTRREILNENKWRALRYGHDATFISPDGTQTKSLNQVVESIGDRLNLTTVPQLLDEESGATRQRRICKDAGPQALADALLL